MKEYLRCNPLARVVRGLLSPLAKLTNFGLVVLELCTLVFEFQNFDLKLLHFLVLVRVVSPVGQARSVCNVCNVLLYSLQVRVKASSCWRPRAVRLRLDTRQTSIDALSERQQGLVLLYQGSQLRLRLLKIHI